MSYKKALGCPCPEENILLIQYGHDSTEHYDGISEITCTKCKKRVGRWSGRVLKDNEIENRFGRV